MAEQLKKMFFQKNFFGSFSKMLKEAYPEFDEAYFLNLVFYKDWDKIELKQKMRHTTECLYKSLPKEYSTVLKILRKVAPQIKGFEGLVFSDYVELYGMDHWDLSLPALRDFNQCCSSEFAIRPFIIKDSVRTMEFMYFWAQDDEPHVRRLASEGCRPRLPWAMALPAFKKDPSPILPILEKLKNDESESVRRSVANNLNDISKDNPKIVLEICEQWFGESENVNRIVKHACRTLLKSGNTRAMLLFGFGDPSNLFIENLKFDKEHLSIGDDLIFTFDLKVSTKHSCKVRLEYAVHFLKANNKLSHKVFQIKEAKYEPGIYTINKKHSFKEQTTRKHYAGEHHISVIVNGVEKDRKSFVLK